MLYQQKTSNTSDPRFPWPSAPGPGVHPRRLSDLRGDRYQGDGLHELRGGAVHPMGSWIAIVRLNYKRTDTGPNNCYETILIIISFQIWVLLWWNDMKRGYWQQYVSDVIDSKSFVCLFSASHPFFRSRTFTRYQCLREAFCKVFSQAREPALGCLGWNGCASTTTPLLVPSMAPSPEKDGVTRSSCQTFKLGVNLGCVVSYWNFWHESLKCISSSC